MPVGSARKRTVEAFSCRVDYGEVVAGASSYHQVKWSPLFDLTSQTQQGGLIPGQTLPSNLGRSLTYMFTRHIAHVSHVHDATLMSNHADSDGVFTHLRRHIFVHLDAQILQHQQT